MKTPKSISELIENKGPALDVTEPGLATNVPTAPRVKLVRKISHAQTKSTKKPVQPKARANKKTTRSAAGNADVAKSPITGKKVTSTWANMTKAQREAKYAYNREAAARKRAEMAKAAGGKKKAKKHA